MATHNEDIDIAALWRAVYKRFWWLMGISLITGVIAYALLSTLTPKYSSEARILIDSDETVYTRPVVGERRVEPVRVDTAIVSSQVQVLSSGDLLLKVAEKLNLAGIEEFDPKRNIGVVGRILRFVGLKRNQERTQRQEALINAMDERLSVYPVSGSHVIAVSFSSESPELAANVANSLSEAYVEWQRGAKLKANKGASEWLAKEISRLRESVRQSEAKAEDFRAKTGLQAGQNNTTLSAQQLSELNSQLILAKAQRSEAEARASLIKDMLDKREDINAASDVLRSALIQRLLEQRVQVQRLLAELSATLKPSHPRVQQLRSELAGLKKQIRDEAQKIAQSLSNEAKIALAREVSLSNSLKALKDESAGLSGNAIKLRALEREAKANRDLLESYLARYRDATSRRDSASVPANATIISKAYVSSMPSFPRKGPMTALFMGAAALLFLTYVVTGELIRGGSPSTASAAPHLPGDGEFRRRASDREKVVARVAREREGDVREENVVEATPEPSQKAESIEVPVGDDINVVCAEILSDSGGDRGYRLLVTGSEDEVDARHMALQTARILSKADKKVVLVDLARKANSLAGDLELSRVPGMSELINETKLLDEVVKEDPDSNTHIIFPGRSSRSAIRDDVKAGRIRVFDALDQVYDIVLVYRERNRARSLFRDMDADFDAGMLVVEGTSEEALKPGRFLGFTVSGLKLYHVDNSSMQSNDAPTGEA